MADLLAFALSLLRATGDEIGFAGCMVDLMSGHPDWPPMPVRLRPLAIGDVPAVHEWAQREDVCRYQPWGPNTLGETREFVREAVGSWKSRPQHRFVYAVVADSRVVGTAQLRLRGDDQGEIAYLIHPDRWGRGLATAAARQLLVLGFVDHSLHRIFATCDPRNNASRRVLEKIGMVYEGRMRETVRIRDGWRDSDLYAILCHEMTDGA